MDSDRHLPNAVQPGTARKRSITDVATTDPRQKRKVTRACDICKAKKAKCSGTQPCNNCVLKGWNCLYQSSYTRGKPPTPVPNVHVASVTYNDSMRTTHSPIIQAQEVPSRASPELEISGQYSDSTSGLSFLHRAWARLSNNRNSQLADGTLETSEDDQLLVSAGDKPFRRGSGSPTIPSLSRCRHL